MENEKTPAKYGPVSLGKRTPAGLFTLEAPANYGYHVTFALVNFKPYAAYMVRAINCHDDLLEAAQLLETAETHHANCEECEGMGVPELCPVCFPLFDDARVKRRLAIAKAQAA